MDSLAHHPRRPTAALWLAALALAAAAGLVLHGPIPQWPGYHEFADARGWDGLPHAANLLSNLPFFAVGLWGWLRLAHRPGLRAWRTFAVLMIVTAAGSAFYHWHPDNLRLVADRLPIACACACLLCAFLCERLHPRWASGATLAAAVCAASAAVAWWWIGEAAGHGDLRAYVFVQFLPMLMIPVGLALGMEPLAHQAVPARAWICALALYAAAKAMEMADAQVLHVLGFISGHSLKHLFAAAAAWCLLGAAIRAFRHGLEASPGPA